MKIDEIVSAKFVKAESFGIFLEYDEKTIFVQVVDRDWSQSFYDPVEFSKLSETYDVIIQGYAPEKNLFYGSIKDAHPELDPWNKVKDLKVGDTLSGVSTRNTAFGTFIEIYPGLVGLLHKIDGGGALKIYENVNVTIKIVEHQKRRMEFLI